MTEVVYVADHSPVLFLQGVADAIRHGFYADDTVQGAPFLGIVNEIRLTQSEEPAQRHPELAEMTEVNITAYDPTLYILDVQDAILMGFDIVPETVQLHYLPYTVQLKRPAVKLDIEPVKSQKPAKAKQTPKSKEA